MYRHRCLLLLAACFVVRLALIISAGPPPDLQLAVIPREGPLGPTPALVAQVEKALSTGASVRLLDRQFIDKVWREQTPSFAGLSTGAGAIQAGELLNAPLLLLIERQENPLGEPRRDSKLMTMPFRCRIVETRTGVALGSFLIDFEGLRKEAAAAVASVRRAAAKSRLAPDQRRYVSLLDFRCEGAGSKLHSARDAMAALLVKYLSASPSIVMLDLDQLNRLRAEENPTGFETKLKGSVLLLTGDIRRAKEAGQLRFSVSIEPQARKAGPAAAVTGPREDFAALRRKLAHELLSQLKAQPPEAPPLDPKKEAELFAARAHRQAQTDNLRAAEESLACSTMLDPGQWSLRRAKGVYKVFFRKMHDRLSAKNEPNDAVLMPLALSASVRETRLWRDYWRGEMRSDKQQIRMMPSEKLLGSLKSKGTMRDRLRRVPAAWPIWLEWLQEHRDHYYEALRWSQDDWVRTGQRERWNRTVRGAILSSRYWTEDPAEWRKILFQVIGLLEKPPVKDPAGDKQNTIPDELFDAFSGFCLLGHVGMQRRVSFAKPGADSVVDAVASWLDQQDAPRAQLARLSHEFKNWQNIVKMATARRVLDNVMAAWPGLKGLPPAYTHPTEIVKRSFRSLIQKEDIYLQYWRRMIEPSLTPERLTDLLPLQSTIKEHVRHQRERGRPKEVEIYSAYLKTLRAEEMVRVAKDRRAWALAKAAEKAEALALVTEKAKAYSMSAFKYLSGLLVTEYGATPEQKAATGGAFQTVDQLGQPIGGGRVIESLAAWRYDARRNGVAAGFLKIDQPGEYAFVSNSFYDRNALYVGQTSSPLCGFRDGEGTMTKVRLPKGMVRIISMGYIHAHGGCKVTWKPPGQADLSPIPPALLFHSQEQEKALAKLLAATVAKAPTAKAPARATEAVKAPPAKAPARATEAVKAPSLSAHKYLPGLLVTEYDATAAQRAVKGGAFQTVSQLGQPVGGGRVIESVAAWRYDAQRNGVAAGFLKIDKPGEYAFVSSSFYDRNALYVSHTSAPLCGYRDGEGTAARIRLGKGMAPIVSIGYVHARGGCKVTWKPPGQKDFSPIPPALFYHSEEQERALPAPLAAAAVKTPVAKKPVAKAPVAKAPPKGTEAVKAFSPSAFKHLPGLLVTEYAITAAQKAAKGGAFQTVAQLGQPTGQRRVIESVAAWRYDAQRNAVAAGFLKIDEPGEYAFVSNSFYDRNALYVGHTLAPLCGYRDGERTVAKIRLPKGMVRLVSIGYVHARGGCTVTWKPPGQTEFSPIPPALLHHREEDAN